RAVATAMERNPERRWRDAERACRKRRSEILPGDEQERLAVANRQRSEAPLEVSVEYLDLGLSLPRQLPDRISAVRRRRLPPFRQQQVPRSRKEPRPGVVRGNVRKFPPGDRQRLGSQRLRIAAAAPPRISNDLRKINKHLPEPSLRRGSRIGRHTRYCRERPKPLHTMQAHPTTQNAPRPRRDRAANIERHPGSRVTPEHWPTRA